MGHRRQSKRRRTAPKDATITGRLALYPGFGRLWTRLTVALCLGRERLGQGKEVEGLPPNNDFLTLKHENMILRAELDQYKGADADKSKTE